MPTTPILCSITFPLPSSAPSSRCRSTSNTNKKTPWGPVTRLAVTRKIAAITLASSTEYTWKKDGRKRSTQSKRKRKGKSKWKTPTRKEEKKEGRETRWRWDLERFLIKQYENITANCRRQWRKNTKWKQRSVFKMGMNKSDMANWFCFEITQKKKKLHVCYRKPHSISKKRKNKSVVSPSSHLQCTGKRERREVCCWNVPASLLCLHKTARAWIHGHRSHWKCIRICAIHQRWGFDHAPISSSPSPPAFFWGGPKQKKNLSTTLVLVLVLALRTTTFQQNSSLTRTTTQDTTPEKRRRSKKKTENSSPHHESSTKTGPQKSNTNRSYNYKTSMKSETGATQKKKELKKTWELE